MNIQNEDTSRSDPVSRDDGQNLEISARIRIISNSYPCNPSLSVIKQCKSGWDFKLAAYGFLLWPMFHLKTPLCTLDLNLFRTFSDVSYAHGTKIHTIKLYFMYVSAFRAADSMSSDKKSRN